MSIRAVPFPHIRNARDLGGLFGADGRRIRRGCLLRSAHLGEAQEADEQLLRETWRLRTVIDLRTGREAERHPDRVMPGIEQVTVSQNMKKALKSIEGAEYSFRVEMW